MKQKRIVVCGAGGFIGGHLVADLLNKGHLVRALDIKPFEDWHQLHRHPHVDNRQTDLRYWTECIRNLDSAEWVYNLAADMGGIGFIEGNKTACMLSVLVTTHVLKAAYELGIQRVFYSSSACVYAADKQTDPSNPMLKEEDAYPAMPEDGYGWEKLFGERMHRHFMEDYGIETRVARYHNIYGPNGSWCGGREKAPAAISRKVAEAKLHGKVDIEIWGDGTQSRSFCWVDDCVRCTQELMESGIREPVNIGSDELVTVNELVDLVESFAEIKLHRTYKLDAPKGVAGRCSDNTLYSQLVGQPPSTSLAQGMARTYAWVEAQVKHSMEA